MHRLLNVLILTGLLATSGCIHKVSIQQGNYLDKEAVQRVEEGMTRDQVRILLGTPMADDPFGRDRWDYIYHFKNGRTGQVTRKYVSVHFEGDAVSRIEEREG